MQIEEYQKYRKAGMELMSKLFERIGKNNLVHAALDLDMFHNGNLVADLETDQASLMDVCVFEKDNQNKILVDEFYETAEELPDIEEDVLEGVVNNYLSVFEIKSINKDAAIIIISDVLDKNKKEYPLIDINLSRTALPGQIFVTRLIAIKDVFMTSGISLGFDHKSKDKFLDDLSFLRLKKRRKLTSKELFVFSFYKHKEYGIISTLQEIQK